MTAPDAQREAIYRAAVRQMTEDRKPPGSAPEVVVRRPVRRGRKRKGVPTAGLKGPLR